MPRLSKQNHHYERSKDLAGNRQLLRSILPSKVRDKVRSFFGENPAIPLAELPCESPRQRLVRVGLCKPTVSVDIKMCLSAEFDNRLDFFFVSDVLATYTAAIIKDV